MTLGDEHTTQYTDNVLQKFTPETYIILSTNVTPIHSIDTKEKELNKRAGKPQR